MRNQRILGHFNESATLQASSAEILLQPIAQAADLMFAALSQGNKIIACGNGGAALSSQHFSAKLLGQFERERLPLPALSLATDVSNFGAVETSSDFREIFSKQVQAFGQSGDVLLAISTSGKCDSVRAAIDMAHEREMRVVALTGDGGGDIAGLLTEADVLICVPHERVARIQEVHILVIHCLCDGIDAALFGGDVNE